MIFAPHIIVGATIGAKTHNLGLIIILGLLTHFIMDKLPHWDYFWLGIKNFKKTKNFKALFYDFLKMGIDCTVGFLIVLPLLWYKNFLNFDYLPFILLGIFVSLLPDINFGLVRLIAGRPTKYTEICEKNFHYKNKEKEGKITFLGLSTEILVIIISAIILSF